MPAKKTHDTLASALAAAQGEMANVSKDAKNTHFQSTYATLASLRDAVIPVLAAHGIACVQICEGDGSSVSITTRFMFGSEVMDCGKLTIPTGGARNPAHAAGAAVTYGRRFSLGAACNVAAADEDDGAASRDDDGNSLDGTRAAPARPARMDKAAHVTQILRREIGCKTKEDAEAMIRYVTDGRLGLASLDVEGEEVLGALNSLRDACRGNFDGVLGSAVEQWEAQA